MIINNNSKEVELVGLEIPDNEMIMVICDKDWSWDGIWEKNKEDGSK